MGNKDDLTDAHTIRRIVFVEEQGVTDEEEFDDRDGECIHLVIYDGEDPVCTGRILLGEGEDEFRLGRIATMMTHRGRGIATTLVENLINACVTMGGTRQTLHAQIVAQGFYEKVGFTAFGEPFDDAGIPHISMEHFGGVKKCGGGHCGNCAKGHH